MFSVACFIHGSTLLSSFVVGITKQDTWVAVIAGFIASLCFALIYITLSKKFPGKNIISINDIVFGKIFGKVVSIFYLFFFMSLVFLNTREVSNFVSGYIMPETPIVVIISMGIATCAYAVKHGITTMVRYSFLCMVLMISVKLLSSLLLLPEMNFSNFSPSFTLPLMDYAQGTHTIAILPFSEVMVFLMIFPYVDEKYDIKKFFLKGMLIAFGLMLIVCIRDWATLGAVSTVLSQLTFETSRLVSYGDIISRIELVFAVVLLVLQVFKISILFYAVVLGTAQIFGLKSYKPLISVLGVIVICASIIVWDSVAESAYWGANVAAVYSTFFEVIIPSVTLVIILFKEKKVKRSTAKLEPS